MSNEVEHRACYNKRWWIDHDYPWTANAIARDRHSLPPGYGYLYAGFAKGMIKIGMSHFQCPLCRMSQQSLRPMGLQLWYDIANVEKVVKKRLGRPTKGCEWFDDPDARLRWLIECDVLTPIQDFESKVFVLFQNEYKKTDEYKESIRLIEKWGREDRQGEPHAWPLGN